MRQFFCLPILTVLVASCADVPEAAPDEAAASQPLVTSNRITFNRITFNRIGLTRIGLTRIGLTRISNSRMMVNPSAAGTMLVTEEGREVFSLVVSCAIPEDMTLVANVNGTTLEFPGEIGLAPQWLGAPLDPIGQGWVSACMLARVNAREVALPISMRGPRFALLAKADERAAFTLEEGAFFGNLFGPTNEPFQAYACRGRDQARGETGGLVDRDCTEPDPANPGFTQCGMISAGDCGAFAARQSCEFFADRPFTFYLDCHNAPISSRPRRDDRVFHEVITTFVTP